MAGYTIKASDYKSYLSGSTSSTSTISAGTTTIGGTITTTTINIGSTAGGNWVYYVAPTEYVDTTNTTTPYVNTQGILPATISPDTMTQLIKQFTDILDERDAKIKKKEEEKQADKKPVKKQLCPCCY